MMKFNQNSVSALKQRPHVTAPYKLSFIIIIIITSYSQSQYITNLAKMYDNILYFKKKL